MPPTIIEGKRIFLRRPSKKDQTEYIALNRRSISFNRGLASPPTQSKEFSGFLKRCRLDTTTCFLICRRRDSVILGSISLSRIHRGRFQSASLGYHIGAEFAQQGYMKEAVALMLSYAFKNLKLHRLEANIQPHNTASINLVKRAGFVLEGHARKYLKILGHWRDHERWAILAEDWYATKMHKQAQRSADFLRDG